MTLSLRSLDLGDGRLPGLISLSIGWSVPWSGPGTLKHTARLTRISPQLPQAPPHAHQSPKTSKARLAAAIQKTLVRILVSRGTPCERLAYVVWPAGWLFSAILHASPVPEPLKIGLGPVTRHDAVIRTVGYLYGSPGQERKTQSG